MNTPSTIDMAADLGIEPDINTQVNTQVSTAYKSGCSSSVEERAMNLLGTGVGQEAVASALGVSPSRITQLLAKPEFSEAVSKLRYDNLQKHNQRDTAYDTLEDKLLDKLEKSLPLIYKPTDLLKAITVVNGAKRRGQDNPAAAAASSTIVNLSLPTIITDKFVVNTDNQVIQAGTQELLTMQSGNLKEKVEAARSAQIEAGNKELE